MLRIKDINIVFGRKLFL